ncbi:hypothetical protein VMF7928_01107 [Vibrio marisflavi CECT 7928]|uniref:Type VI secretion system-associated protein TagO n=2 Tax=Vibrio marisflavi TaxID=1216040 RepID=A0ABM9A165_9VIBR|nr:hypothetical protein VMF7928_01107 [Vibrio marisflavi CECT 7928]
MKAWCISTALLAFGLGSGASAFAAQRNMTAPQQIAKANQCREINNNLQRLACFDNLFNTPLRPAKADKFNEEKPLAWQWAISSESNRSNSADTQGAFLFNQNDTLKLGKHIWLTAPAVNANPRVPGTDQPILMLSCVENISRVELVFPTAINVNKVPVTLLGNPTITQQWVSDSSGYVLRTGRGLPAVKLMKSMLSTPRLVMRSSIPELNGLTFNTSHLSSLIKPMRQACHW